MKKRRITATYPEDVLLWLSEIAKREGFNLSQTLSWVLRKTMESDQNARD
jgi:hypothetical protein